MTNVTLPTDGDGYTVGNSAFGGCKITEINLSKMKSSGQAAFNGCASLQRVTMPTDRDYTLANDIFKNCTSLESINLERATSLGVNCFYKCSALKKVNLPNVTSLGYQCFNNCSALEKVTLGAEISSFGEWAFYYCRKLKSVTILAETPPTLEGTSPKYCFARCDDSLKIYVPASALTDYRDAWREHANNEWGSGDVDQVIVAIGSNNNNMTEIILPQ